MKQLIKSLKKSDSLVQKETIQKIWSYFPQISDIDGGEVLLGDDAAAIEFGNSYLLIAGEGVYPPLLKLSPYLAGRVSVLTNVNDIYAMGGRPMAIVDVLISDCDENMKDVLSGIKENAARYRVPVVGGHVSQDSGCSSLSVFIIGKAEKILSSFNAQKGDDLVFVFNPNGKFVSGFNFWDSSSTLESSKAIKDLELIAEAAEEGLADAAKDVSMSGLIGSLLMILESSQVGAEINVDTILRPCNVPLAKWLVTFPSFGFIFSLRPEKTSVFKDKFSASSLSCESIGRVVKEKRVYFIKGEREKELFWNIEETPFIGVNLR